MATSTRLQARTVSRATSAPTSVSVRSSSRLLRRSTPSPTSIRKTIARSSSRPRPCRACRLNRLLSMRRLLLSLWVFCPMCRCHPSGWRIRRVGGSTLGTSPDTVPVTAHPSLTYVLRQNESAEIHSCESVARRGTSRSTDVRLCMRKAREHVTGRCSLVARPSSSQLLKIQQLPTWASAP